MSAGQAAQQHLREVGTYFFRLGVLAFGGPAAHIALMRRELVQQRKWLTDDDFVDILGVTNLIPGPNSTEMTMHLGHRRAGWLGLVVGGAGFIIPAVALTLGLAWAYVEYGDTPAGEALILGIQPFMLAIILQAIWGLRGAVTKAIAPAVIAVAAVGLNLLGVHEAILVLGGGAAGLAWWFARSRATPSRLASIVVAPVFWLPAAAQELTRQASATELFWIFLKIGAVLYGSGYVLLAFLETELVDNRGWLTDAQLVDAVSAGQFTPGPVFSTATFIGYVLGGWDGALAATAGIFAPSFFFVALVVPIVPRLRKRAWSAAFLDGVNAAALALMGVVMFQLGREVLDGWYTALLFAAGAVVLLRWSPNSAWLVLAGAFAGLAHALLA